MIHYITGNIFDSKADALVNTVNTVGVMGKGLALQFKEVLPENYRIYHKICKEKKFDIGEMLVTEESNATYGHKIIINFPTKRHWRYPSEYIFISQGLAALKKEIESKKIKSIAIPALGSHNGGLDWQRVKPMIEKSLADLECDIYIYEPTQAISEKMNSERTGLTPARAMLIIMLADICKFGEFASVFAAEKVIYFMQRLGGKNIFKIDFKPYIYGPYSGGKVAHVLYHLNGSYIKGMTALEARPFDYIWLTTNAESEAIAFLQTHCDKTSIDICNRTKGLLRSFYSNYSLELLSTVDFILNALHPSPDWRQSDRNTIERTVTEELKKWSKRKGMIFKPDFISKAIEHLSLSDISYNNQEMP